MTDGNNQVWHTGYDVLGRMVSQTAPSGVVTTYGWDGLGRNVSSKAPGKSATTIAYTPDSTSLASWSYGRLAGGRLASQTATGVGATNAWSYDPGFQLASQSAGPAQSYGYDVDGNPTSLAGATQSFDASGEVTSTGFGYDANGLLTSSTASGGSSSYTYAADGLRVSKSTGSVTTGFAWDDNTQVPELIGDGSDYYLYGPDGLPVERTGASPTVWLHQDATASVRLTTDGTGAVTSTETFTPWGTQAAHTGTPPSLGYDSQYTDAETGYLYLRNRYYDPATAQFLTPDPLFALTGERYGYAGNDPIDNDDPSGLFHIPGTDYCVDIGDSSCHSRADGKSLKDSPGAVVRNRGSLATVAAAGWCLVPAVGWASCGVAQLAASGMRASQRASEHGFTHTWKADLGDLALTYAFFSVAAAPEADGALEPISQGYSFLTRIALAASGMVHDLYDICVASEH